MKHRTIFVTFAIILISTIVFCSEMLTSSGFGRWFGVKTQYPMYSSSQEGNVSVVRRGTGYVLKQDIGLEENDMVITDIDSESVLEAQNGSTIYLDENVRILIERCEYDTICINMEKGAMFCSTAKLDDDVFEIILQETVIRVGSESIISVESYEGTQTINVYKGEAFLTQDAGRKAIPAGESLTILQDEDRNISYLYEEINADKLSEFLLKKLSNEEGICFSKEELSAVAVYRAQVNEEFLVMQQEHQEEILAQGGTVAVIAHEKPQTGEQDIPAVNEEVNICTIQIRCDTILDNLEDLTADKEQYVPENGIILDVSQAEFVEGESVYDVLKRVCAYSGIHLSYDWTVEYGGYYIEGINHLYEFDCGNGSGWMYQVNGWYPNYGCSNYILKDGDIIVWRYTCDLGKDVGCDWMK